MDGRLRTPQGMTARGGRRQPALHQNRAVCPAHQVTGGRQMLADRPSNNLTRPHAEIPRARW
jgi:hypothetical protein